MVLLIHNDYLAKLAFEFAIDDSEATKLAVRLEAYLRHSSPVMQSKTWDLLMLLLVLLAMEVPRIGRVGARKKAERQAAATAKQAGEMMGHPNVVPIMPG